MPADWARSSLLKSQELPIRAAQALHASREGNYIVQSRGATMSQQGSQLGSFPFCKEILIVAPASLRI